MVVQTQRISTDAYQALREALTYMLWRKASLKFYLRTALRDAPEVLGEVDWELPKREAVDLVVNRLMDREQSYQTLTLGLMLDVANREDFHEIDNLERPEWGTRGRAAVAELKRLVAMHEPLFRFRQRAMAEESEQRSRMASQRQFRDELDALLAAFYELAGSAMTPQGRGKEFEIFLNRLFELFDLEPRFAYSLPREQLDGAFSFDTDDYVVEAKWRTDRVARHEADTFSKKIERKGRNALGLLVSIDGFTTDALDEYSTGTNFITMEGTDVVAVLTGAYRLEEVLRRKKRHMNEEGSCYFPVGRF